MITILGFLLFIIIAIETSNHITRGPFLTKEDNEEIDEMLYYTTGIEGNIIQSKEGWFSYHPFICPWAPINVSAIGESIGRIPVWHSKYKKIKRIFKTQQFN